MRINRFYNPEPKRLDSEKLSEQVKVTKEGYIECGGRTFRVVIKENGKEVQDLTSEQQEIIAKKMARIINEAGFKKTTDLSKVQVNSSGITVRSKLPQRINRLFFHILNQKYIPRNKERFGELFEKVSKRNFEKAEKTEKEREIVAAVKAKSENPGIKKARVLHDRFGEEFKSVRLDKKTNSVIASPSQLRRAVELAEKNFPIKNLSNEEAHQLVDVILCGKKALRAEISKSTRPPFKLFKKDGPKGFHDEEVSPRAIESYKELKDKTAIEQRFKLFQQSSHEGYKEKETKVLIRGIQDLFSKDFFTRGTGFTIHIGNVTIAGEHDTEATQALKAFQDIKAAYMNALLKDKGAFNEKLKESKESGLWKELLAASNGNIDKIFEKENIKEGEIDYLKQIKEAANLTPSEKNRCMAEGFNTDDMEFLIKAKFFEVMMIVNQSAAPPITDVQLKWLPDGTFPSSTNSVHDFYFDSLMTGYTYQLKSECTLVGVAYNDGKPISLKMEGKIEVEDLYGKVPPKMTPISQLEEIVHPA